MHAYILLWSIPKRRLQKAVDSAREHAPLSQRAGEKIPLHTSERQLVNYIYVQLENWMYSDVNCWENPGKRNVHPGYILVYILGYIQMYGNVNIIKPLFSSLPGERATESEARMPDLPSI